MPSVFINEISITGSNGSVEIAAVGGTDLFGWQVAFYNFDFGANDYVHVGSQILPDTTANNSFGFSSANLGLLRGDGGWRAPMGTLCRRSPADPAEPSPLARLLARF